jgi:hypothetical protein
MAVFHFHFASAFTIIGPSDSISSALLKTVVKLNKNESFASPRQTYIQEVANRTEVFAIVKSLRSLDSVTEWQTVNCSARIRFPVGNIWFFTNESRVSPGATGSIQCVQAYSFLECNAVIHRGQEYAKQRSMAPARCYAEGNFTVSLGQFLMEERSFT